MGRMMTLLTVKARKPRTFGALIDSGSGVTILSNIYARAVGLSAAPEERLDIGGYTRNVCYRTVDLHIPDTDCLVESMQVAVISSDSEDIPGAIIGADFLQRTGALLDFRRGRHAVASDPDGPVSRRVRPRSASSAVQEAQRALGR